MRKVGPRLVMIMALNIANLVDLITTLTALKMGYVEGNILLNYLMNISLELMIFVKIAIPLLISILLIYMTRKIPFNNQVLSGAYMGLVIGISFSAFIMVIVSLHNILLLNNYVKESGAIFLILSKIILAII